VAEQASFYQPWGQTANLVGQEAVLALSRRLDEPEWLREQRLDAWEVFLRSPAPRWQRGIKGWWLTDLTALRLERMGVYAAPAGSNAAPRPSRSLGGALSFRNSVAVGASLAPDLADQGVLFAALPSAVRDYPELVERYLGRLVHASEGKFAALAAALWSNGLFVYVPAGVTARLPLRVQARLEAPGLAQSWRTVVVAEPGSRVTLIEELGSTTAASSSLFATTAEVYVGEGASVDYVTMEEWGRGISSLAAKRALVERDGRMRWIAAYVGGDMIRSIADTTLAAEGATVESLGLFFAGERQHLDLNASTTHEAPHTAANMLLNGAVKDAAHAAFAGTIRVQRPAQGAESYLGSHTLALGEAARVDVVPSLEIEANDVHVSHGATAGKLDEEQLFYLMSRGLSRRQAASVLVRGFFEPILARIPPAGVRARLERAVERKMAQ